MSDISRKQDGTTSSDSEDFYSADDDIPDKQASHSTKGSLNSPDQRKRGSSPKDKKKQHVITGNQLTIDDEAPIAPPRRRKKHFNKQTSLEEPVPTDRLLLTSEDIRKTNTFSWPRGEKPTVRYKEEETTMEEGGGSTDSTPVHKSSLQTKQLERSTDKIVKHKQPSISIEPNESLELTEDLLENSKVESNDIILVKGSNTAAGHVVTLFLHSEDEDSMDGDRVRGGDDTTGRDQSDEDYEEEDDEGEEGTDGGVVKQDRTPPSDSQILEATYIKNLDTGEAFPLSLADKRIPKGRKNPVDSQCDEREKGRKDSWDGGLHEQEDNNGDSEGATANPKKPRKKRFVKKFFKGRDKKKSEARKSEMLSCSDDETSPEHDHHSIKYKPASHNKGTLEYEHVRLKQELSHNTDNETMAVWVIEFSICGRLLATAGQDSVVRVWVLRTAYHFFHDLQVKYAKFGVHSSADSLSERSSVNSSMSSDPDDESTSLKPFLEQPLCTYTGHSADVLDLSWSKNFFLLSSSMDKTVRLWHMSRKECLCCFQHVDFVTSVAFHPRDDRYFLSGSLDGKLRLWNIPDKKVALWNEIEGVGSHLITAANFCMNGKLAVAGTYDGRCIFYETEHLKYHTQIHVKSRHGKNRGRKISGIVPLPGEDKILVTSNDSRLRLYNLKDHSLTCKYKGCLNSGSQIRATFSREGEYIICGSEDNYIYVWKTHHDFNKLSSARRDRNDYYESFSAHSAPVTAVSFAPVPGITVDEGLRDVGEVIVAGDYKGHIKIYVNSEKL